MSRTAWSFAVGWLLTSSVCWAQSLEYRDEVRKFRITGPEGWYRQDGEMGAVVRYVKDPARPMPILGVTIDNAGGGSTRMNSALEFSKMVLSELRTHQPITVVEPPHEIELNGWHGSRFMYERTGQMTWEEHPSTVRHIYWQFMQGNEIVSLVVLVEAKELDTTVTAIQRCIDSFQHL